MNQTLRVFITCFLGAFVGGVVALQLSPVFWWAGALFGAFTAYIGYNVEEAVAAVPVAWNRVVNWTPNKVFWACWRSSFTYMFNMSFNIGVGFSIVMWLMIWMAEMPSPQTNELMFLLVGGALSISVSVGTIVALLAASAVAEGYLRTNGGLPKFPTCPNVFRFYLRVAPVAVFKAALWSIVHVPAAITLMWAILVTVIESVWELGVEFFRLVHSEIRLLCAVDAALGTAVGYFTGNALIGAIVGGALGVLNYEIITVLVMKVAGAKSVFK